MSHWSKVQTEIKDSALFLEICDKHGLKISGKKEGVYELNLADGSGRATMERNKDGNWILSYDQDRSYSRFAERIGTNGGTLMRDYATQMTERQAYGVGMMITNHEIRQDGSIRLVLAG